MKHQSLNKPLAIAIAAGLLTIAVSYSSFSTTHYQWVNERGDTVYSDRPPSNGIDYEVVSTDSGLKRQVSGSEGAVPRENQPRVGNEFTAVESEAKSKKNQALCERATENFEALSGTREIQVRDGNGEVRTLSPEEKEISRQSAKAQISVYCTETSER